MGTRAPAEPQRVDHGRVDRRDLDDATTDDAGADAAIATQAESLVRRYPWLESVMRVGWAAKAVVYSLMGLIAVAIARSGRSDEDASPEGALSVVMERTAGRVLLGVLAVGLVLYGLWRVFTVALVRGSGARPWAERVGYGFSAVFYLMLAWTAVRSVLAGRDPERSSTVEDLSSALLGSNAGRVLVGVGGVVTILVSLYFARTAVTRSYRDDLDLDAAGERECHVVDVSGVVGWSGRATVTFLVGLFVTVAAVTADPSEARGFDRSLRRLAEHDPGAWAVLASALGLVTYGVFCLVSLRHRRLTDD